MTSRVATQKELKKKRKKRRVSTVWNRDDASAQPDEQPVPVSRQFWQIAAKTVTFHKSAHKSAVSCLLNKKCRRGENAGPEHSWRMTDFKASRGRRCSCLIPRSKYGCNYVFWVVLTKTAPTNQRWRPWKSGAGARRDVEPGNPIASSRTLFESREHFHCSVIISTKSIRHMWSWLEVLTSDLECSASLQSFVSAEQSEKKKKKPLEDLMELCCNKQTNRHNHNICLWSLWNSCFRGGSCHFFNAFVPTRERV